MTIIYDATCSPFLKVYSSKKGRQIALKVRYNNITFEIDIKDDNKKNVHANKIEKGIVTESRNNTYLNSLISRRKNQIQKAINFLGTQKMEINRTNVQKFMYDENGKEKIIQIADDNFMKIIRQNDNEIPNLKKSFSQNIIEIFEDFKKDSPRTTHRILKSLKGYIEFRNLPGLYIQDINYNFMNDFANYLSSTDLTISSIKTNIKHTKAFIRWMLKQGININRNYQDFQLQFGKKESAHIKYKDSELLNVAAETLKPEEFKKLTSKDYNDFQWNLTKNRFYFQVMAGGLRVSDLKKVNADCIRKVSKDNVRINMMHQKTSLKIDNKLDERCQEILKKHGFNLFKFNAEDYNKQLKIIAKKAGIDREETYYTLKAKEVQTKKVKICDVISSKTARKTAVSYAASLGFNEIEIGRFTAHTSDAIRHYLNIFSEQLDIMIDAISKDINK